MGDDNKGWIFILFFQHIQFYLVPLIQSFYCYIICVPSCRQTSTSLASSLFADITTKLSVLYLQKYIWYIYKHYRPFKVNIIYVSSTIHDMLKINPYFNTVYIKCIPKKMYVPLLFWWQLKNWSKAIQNCALKHFCIRAVCIVVLVSGSNSLLF